MTIRLSPAWRHFAGLAGVAACLAAPLAAQTNQSVMIFPTDKPDTVDQSLANTVSGSLEANLRATGRYDIATFYAKSPLVQRSVQAGSLTAAQIAGPFTADGAASIAKNLGADYALVSSIEDSSIDVSNKATVTLTAQLIAASDGHVVKAAGVTGSGVNANNLLSPDALTRLAANDAATKASAQLFGGAPVRKGRNNRPQTVAVPVPTAATVPSTGTETISIPVENKRHKGGGGLLVLGGLALIGVIIASSGGGHSSSGGGTSGGGNPPSFPF